MVFGVLLDPWLLSKTSTDQLLTLLRCTFWDVHWLLKNPHYNIKRNTTGI